MFATTYACEQFFSVINVNKSEVHFQLTDLHLNSIFKQGWCVQFRWLPRVRALDGHPGAPLPLGLTGCWQPTARQEVNCHHHPPLVSEQGENRVSGEEVSAERGGLVGGK